MKKIITILALLLSVNALKAQIELEHTFENEKVDMGRFFNIDYSKDEGIIRYHSYKENKMRFYKDDFSFDKEITLDIPSDYYIMWTSYFSRKLFNDDEKIEFMVTIRGRSTDYNSNESEYLRIYNEDGLLIKDLGTSNYFNDSYVFIDNSNKLKLLVSRKSYEKSEENPVSIDQTDIYSLPGKAPVGTKNITKAEQSISAYPNPAKKSIYLTYDLSDEQKGTLIIYDDNGRMVEQKEVTKGSNRILVDVSRYNAGVYVYVLNGISKKFIVR